MKLSHLPGHEKLSEKSRLTAEFILSNTGGAVPHEILTLLVGLLGSRGVYSSLDELTESIEAECMEILNTYTLDLRLTFAIDILLSLKPLFVLLALSRHGTGISSDQAESRFLDEGRSLYFKYGYNTEAAVTNPELLKKAFEG